MRIDEFLEFLSVVPDFRDEKKVSYSLVSILFITFCAVLCKAESWCDVHDFGEAKAEWLSQYVDIKNGIPSEWTFRRIFVLLAPEHLERLLRTIASWLVSGKSEEQISIDGKALGSVAKFLKRQIYTRIC